MDELDRLFAEAATAIRKATGKSLEGGVITYPLPETPSQDPWAQPAPAQDGRPSAEPEAWPGDGAPAWGATPPAGPASQPEAAWGTPAQAETQPEVGWGTPA
ncbi:MAG: hypothetical protein AB1758_33555, partial [Candidatus Eremiobacterota bacterium]